jgi:hypothetical protein
MPSHKILLISVPESDWNEDHVLTNAFHLFNFKACNLYRYVFISEGTLCPQYKDQWVNAV